MSDQIAKVENNNKKKLTSVITWNGETEEFSGWRAQFEANLMLEDEDLYDVLVKHLDADFEAEEKSSRKIMALLIQSIPKKSTLMSGLVVLKNDGIAAYRQWHKKFAGVQANRVMRLWTKITRIERGEHEKITDYLTRLELARMELEDLREPVSELMMMGLALRIGEKESKIMAASMHGLTTFEQVKERLMAYETRDQPADKGAYGADGSGGMAISARGVNKKCSYCKKLGHYESDCFTKQKDENKSGGDRMLCYYCDKAGHVKRDCPKKKRHDEQDGKEDSDPEHGSGSDCIEEFKKYKQYKKDQKAKKMAAANLGITMEFDG
jgi:hypothetical protein